MTREFLVEKLVNIGFVAPPSGWRLFVARFHSHLLTGVNIAIFSLSTVGRYSALQILIASLGFIIYVILSDAILGDRFYGKSRSHQFLRGVIGAILIAVGIHIFPHARGPLWLYFILPFWRLLATDPKPPWGVIVSGLAIGLTLYSHTSIQAAGESALYVLGNTLLKVLWLTSLITILYVYIGFVDRLEESSEKRRQFANALAQQVFEADTLEKWCIAILPQVLELTESTYATFQKCNHLTGDLVLVAAMKRESTGFMQIEPSQVEALIGFSDLESAGITGYVARTGDALAVPDVSKDERYVSAFQDVVAEIAAPVYDPIHKRVGGVLNVEFTKDAAPKSITALAIRKKTLQEIAEQLGQVYSYVMLSSLRNYLRHLSVLIHEKQKVDEILVLAISGLYDYYNCPIGIWLRGQEVESRYLCLEVSRMYPKSYASSEPKVAIATSVMWEYLLNHSEPKQVIQLSSATVDHWKALRTTDPRPTTMVLVPLVGIEEPLGAIQLFTPREVEFPTDELDVLGDLGRQVAISIEQVRQIYIMRSAMLEYETTATAHDLGSSIVSIDSLVGELTEIADGDNARLVEVHKKINLELNFLQDIIALTIAQVRGEPIPCDEYEVKQIIERAEATLRSREVLGIDQLQIRKIQPGANKVYCNRPIVVGALRNLFKNAAEATQRGERIMVSSTLDTSRRFVNIDVRNLGEAIDVNKLDSLFEPGFTTKETGRGIGLGTYQALVKRMGGSLELVQSTRRGGTIFRLQLDRQGGNDV